MLTSLQNFVDPFLPKRFLFMSEEGPSESAGPDEGVGGVSEEAAEAAAEDRKRTAQAAKTQRKQEKKMKKRDGKLADTIREYIRGTRQDDHMALLISRLLQRNTPSSIILAVMSLNDEGAIEVLENYLDTEKDVLPDEIPEDQVSGAAEESQALVEYGRELTQSLSAWTRRIFLHSSFHPMKSILALAHHHGVDKNMIELTTNMIQQYFQSVGQDIQFDKIRQFSEFFWRDALKRLHKLADDRGLLPEPSQDPMSDDDDEDDDDDE